MLRVPAFGLRVGALLITPHAAARMAVVAMMAVGCGVGVVRHALTVALRGASVITEGVGGCQMWGVDSKQ